MYVSIHIDKYVHVHVHCIYIINYIELLVQCTCTYLYLYDVVCHLTHPHIIVINYLIVCYSQGYKQQRAFIIAQGPMQSTARDFWKMIHNRRCGVVVMLSDLVEAGKVGSSLCSVWWHTHCTCVVWQERVFGSMDAYPQPVSPAFLRYLLSHCRRCATSTGPAVALTPTESLQSRFWGRRSKWDSC